MLARISFALLAAILLVAPSSARDRPGTPNGGFAGYCASVLLEPPAMCVGFRNTATEKVGFLMDWTEDGHALSSDLRGRSECLSGSAQAYYCRALQFWFSGDSHVTPAGHLDQLIFPTGAPKFTTDRDNPEGFRVTKLAYDSEYCFRFRAITMYAVISAAPSGWTCARTPPAPDAPKPPAKAKATGIQATSGEGVVGPGTPFKILIEWTPAPDEETTVGWYSIEQWRDKRWIPQATQYKPKSTYEAFAEFPESADPAQRYAFRVCATNILYSACSKETWYYPFAAAETTTTATASATQSARAGRVTTTTTIGVGAATQLVHTAPVPGGATILYGIGNDGVLRWYRHNGAATGAAAGVPGAWADAKNVGQGWGDLKQVFAGGSGVIYGITQDGKLIWYRHAAVLTGQGIETAGAWDASHEVSSDWGNYRKVFSAGGGIIYAITQDGQLLWFKHLGLANGTPEWEGPTPVATGWGAYEQVFSGGNGIIYAVGADGVLKWNRHNGYQSGTDEWAAPRDVGRGWSSMRQVFSVGNGIIYTISQDGVLRWYKHVGYLDGRGIESPGAWLGGTEVGRGWNSFTSVFGQF